MADEKISDLASAGALDGTETPPIVQGSSTVKVTLLVIYTWIVTQLGLRLLPAGGDPGEVLAKTSTADYETEWTSAGLVPPGSVADYVLTQQSATPGDYEWSPVRAVPQPADPADDGKALLASAGDYTWQTVALTPAGGANRSIQYNVTGSGDPTFGGALYAEIRNNALTLNEVAAPIAPGAGQVSLFARKLANRALPAFAGTDDLTALQPFFGRNKIGYWSAIGNASLAPTSFGIAGPVPIGSNGTRSVAATNLFTSLRRSYNVSTAVAGASAGYRTSVAQLFRSASAWGGFFLAARFGEDNVVAGSRSFVGLHSATAAIGNVNPSTLTNLIGVGFDAGQTTWRVVHNDAAGTATTIDLGAGFPCNTSDEAYDVIIFAPPGQSTVWVQMIRLSDETSVTTEITTDVPALNTMLAFHLWANNGATASAKGITISTLYTDANY